MLYCNGALFYSTLLKEETLGKKLSSNDLDYDYDKAFSLAKLDPAFLLTIYYVT